LATGMARGMRFIEKKVPRSVVRGIQLGLALLLIKTSINFIYIDYNIALISVLVIIIFFIISRVRKVPDFSALLILIFGVVFGLFINGIPPITFLPMPQIIIPSVQEFFQSTWLLVLPQIPLTVTNAILATSLLINDLFKVKVESDRLSKTIGFMNISSVIFGGLPMCHGAGSLAADYRFGARTGGTNIISGLLLLPVALFFASPQFVQIIPQGIYGALLIFIAIELGRNSLKTDSYIVTFIIAILALSINITLGFIVGLILAYILAKKKNLKLKGPNCI